MAHDEPEHWPRIEDRDVDLGLRRLQRSTRLGVVIAAVGACVLLGLAVALYAGLVSGRVSLWLVMATLGAVPVYLLVDRWIERRIERAAGEIEGLSRSDDDGGGNPAR